MPIGFGSGGGGQLGFGALGKLDFGPLNQALGGVSTLTDLIGTLQDRKLAQALQRINIAKGKMGIAQEIGNLKGLSEGLSGFNPTPGGMTTSTRFFGRGGGGAPNQGIFASLEGGGGTDPALDTLLNVIISKILKNITTTVPGIGGR